MNHFKLLPAFYLALFLTSCAESDGEVDSGSQNTSTSAPKVISVSPQLEAKDVALDASITITFDQAIDCDSFRQAFLLEDETNSIVDTTITCDDSVVSVSPTENLERYTVYEIWVSTLLKNQNGVNLPIPFNIDFITVERSWSTGVVIGDHGVGEPFGLGYRAVQMHEPEIAMNDDGDTLATWVISGDPIYENRRGRYASYFDSELNNWELFINLNQLQFDPSFIHLLDVSQALPGVFSSGHALAIARGEAVSDVLGSAPVISLDSNLHLGSEWFSAQPLTDPPLLSFSEREGSSTRVWNFDLKLQDFATHSFRGMALWIKEIQDPVHHLAGESESWTQQLWSGMYIDGTMNWNPPKLVANRVRYADRTQTGPFSWDTVRSGEQFVDAKIAMDTNDNAITAYLIREDGPENSQGITSYIVSLCTNHLAGNTRWESFETCFDTQEDTEVFSNHQIVMDDSGNAMLFWQSYLNTVGSVSTLLFSRFQSLGIGWRDSETVSGAEIAASGWGDGYEVAMNGPGKTVVVWASPEGAINASIYDPVSGWGNTQEVWPDLAQAPQVAINDKGEIVATFVSLSSANSELYAASYKDGQGWSNSSKLTSKLHHGIFVPGVTHDVAIDEVGNAIVVWIEELEKTDTVVMAARFE
ncbi:MAG: Ig-like domain-containing protein [Gammaproteobacteria bacterium]|nr:Ig-like domain-containing protein [Gammaproteobacteria bacterium]